MNWTQQHRRTWFCFFITLFLPMLGFADDTMSFAPPVTDFSVIFLANIFGTVDGVLQGTGSQILGNMFAVFNAAVLALGGMIITYTLLVSTMNTAQDGEMMGKKWSSVWVPVRSAGGLALLMPKASGYCLLQIFVMWTIVQGVGAADKIWNAALNYLNRGGVIIQQKNPGTAIINAATNGIDPLVEGTQKILSGQVCMLGLQRIFEIQLQSAQQQFKKYGTGPCSTSATGLTHDLCTQGYLPSFIGTVNILAQQPQITPAVAPGVTPVAPTLSVDMPNFPTTGNVGNITAQLATFNGICGTIQWAESLITTADPSLSSADSDVLASSRTMAVQTLFNDLQPVAQAMIDNDPQLALTQIAPLNPAAPWAKTTYGYPVSSEASATGTATTCSLNTNCESWSGGLFTGAELAAAMSDYNNAMAPFLRIQANQAASQSDASATRFIAKSEAQGWITAGSYFFDLVRLNGSTAATPTITTDTDPTIAGSKFDIQHMTIPFINLSQTSPTANTNCTPNAPFNALCQLLNGNGVPISNLAALISGGAPGSPGALPSPKSYLTAATNSATAGPLAKVTDPQTSTTYGYLINTAILHIAGQPGNHAGKFANVMNFNFSNQSSSLPPANFGCGGVHILFFTLCIGEILGTVIYNGVISPLMSFFQNLLMGFIEQLIMGMLTIPLEGLAQIFHEGMDILQVPGINPIVALANMGTFYINFAGQLFFTLLNLFITTSITGIGMLLLPVMAIASPLLFAWLSVMVSIGMITAYYIPMLPYMIFTFGAIAWLMAVIEAMVAAPIVAVGITHPEGHEVFGKGEMAIMILMNVFLRPAMMIIGYIAGISLSYVGVWILNAGFDNAIGFMQGSASSGTGSGPTWGKLDSASSSKGSLNNIAAAATGIKNAASQTQAPIPSGISGSTATGGYTGWAGIFAYFMSIVVYTTMYLTIVEKAFSLITALPDKILRWIGGHPESYGQETAQWTEQGKSKIGDAGKETQAGQTQIQRQMQSGLTKAAKAAMTKGAGGQDGGASAK